MSLFVGFSAASAQATTTKPIVLSGKALGPVHIGAKQVAAMATFTKMLGKSQHGVRKTPDETNCGIDALASWSNMQVFFNKGVFTGYNTGYSTKVVATFVTNKGLRIGDTIATAKKLYGTSFGTSAAQGGSWFIEDIAPNQVHGYLTDPPRFGPSDRIAGISAGHVGCPAMTP